MPVKKPDVELGLEFSNQLRDRGLRDAETSCRSGKISGFKDCIYGAYARGSQSHGDSSHFNSNSGRIHPGKPGNEPEAKPGSNIGKSFDCYVTVKRRP